MGVGLITIVMITPYAWNADLINRKIKRVYPCLQGMRPAATVDSFQGSEGDISIYVSVANRAAGPGFISDKNRLNVAMTRQRCGLVIVGDINVLGKLHDGKLKSVLVPGPNGEMYRTNPGALMKLCIEMSKAGRVATPRKPAKSAAQMEEIEDNLAEGVEDEANDKGKENGKRKRED